MPRRREISLLINVFNDNSMGKVGLSFSSLLRYVDALERLFYIMS